MTIVNHKYNYGNQKNLNFFLLGKKKTSSKFYIPLFLKVIPIGIHNIAQRAPRVQQMGNALSIKSGSFEGKQMEVSSCYKPMMASASVPGAHVPAAASTIAQ